MTNENITPSELTKEDGAFNEELPILSFPNLIIDGSKRYAYLEGDELLKLIRSCIKGGYKTNYLFMILRECSKHLSDDEYEYLLCLVENMKAREGVLP